MLLRPDCVAAPQYADNSMRCENRTALDGEINAVFTKLTKAELIQRLQRGRIAYGSVNSVAELSRHPQLRRATVATPAGPVVVVAPNNELLEKLKSNMQEVSARGGQLIVFADADVGLVNSPGVTVLPVAPTEDSIAPIIFSVPLQLLAYHVAALKGTDIDQPRNLAKSVTVE